jgi:hypothetical protein
MIASAAWWHLERGERSGWELDVLPSLQLQSSVNSQQSPDKT